MSSDNLAGIQAQHKILGERMHAVCAHLSNGHSVHAMRDEIDDLVDFLHAHCKEEEKLMQLYGYDGLETHEQEHRDLLARFHSVRDKIYASFDEDNKQALLDFFKHDLIGHVVEDMHAWQEGEIEREFVYQRLQQATVGTSPAPLLR